MGMAVCVEIPLAINSQNVLYFLKLISDQVSSIDALKRPTFHPLIIPYAGIEIRLIT